MVTTSCLRKASGLTPLFRKGWHRDTSPLYHCALTNCHPYIATNVCSNAMTVCSINSHRIHTHTKKNISCIKPHPDLKCSYRMTLYPNQMECTIASTNGGGFMKKKEGEGIFIGFIHHTRKTPTRPHCLGNWGSLQLLVLICVLVLIWELGGRVRHSLLKTSPHKRLLWIIHEWHESHHTVNFTQSPPYPLPTPHPWEGEAVNQ